jgi:hypothetical protein
MTTGRINQVATYFPHGALFPGRIMRKIHKAITVKNKHRSMDWFHMFHDTHLQHLLLLISILQAIPWPI